MPRYCVCKREIWTQIVEVEVEGTELDAIIAVSNGEGHYEDNTLEYSHDMDVEYWTVDKIEVK